ncbi:uncharacterized protein C8A04DRAFT_30228 [Dichotomopilus funicola]|uniref:SPT2 chromatin protein n=1 Tax=Dichotomopilus funicola TaxID=1934379 RepID=A0AAN6V078_9PEZI|nr:hypothetical protein C8A04DRAFT_30228 [Dichotomopilus funicola]
MPILDLLASITGEKPSPSAAPKPTPRPATTVLKRKADDELRPHDVKAPRVDVVTERTSKPGGTDSKPSPRLANRPLIGSQNKLVPTPRPTVEKKTLAEKKSTTSLRVNGNGAQSTNGNKQPPPRPVPSRPSPTDSGPPKKRSYAEIMARAKANSEQRESLGKIQHKTVERNMTMKERKEMKAEEARRAKSGARKGANGRNSPPSARGPLSRDAPRHPGARNGASTVSTAPGKSAPADEKKVKKAATATTGYTGTARPRPGASASTKSGASGRPESGARRDRPRYGGPLSAPRRGGYDEEDDMDDFIVDDEEEEAQPGYGGGGPRYRYDSYDEESDMEAGLTDIEDEEQLADRQARREDLEQEALEKRLKREKEERRRRFLETTKSKASR